MAIRLAVTSIASLFIASLLGAGSAMAEPTITVAPDSGPQGAPFTITGQGFEPEDKIYISIDTLEGVEGYPVAVVTTDADGEFVAHTFVGNIYPGPEFREPAPPGGGQDIHLAPMEWEILAYPESFGGRTGETIMAAPKVRFTVTASSLPETGGPPAAGDSPLAQITVGLVLLIVGGFICQKSLRTRSERPRHRSGD